ncbi:MAG: hypothetical protein AB3N14_12385 [Flavobacteriaceae bacterium]
MKFALILILSSLFVFGCKEQNGSVQHASPKQEVKSPANAEEEDDPSKRPARQLKEQESDQETKKQRPKSALDTLRPKTA